MTVDAKVYCLALLGAFWPGSKGTSAKVQQFPPTLKVSIGGNESMYCKFPIIQDTAEVLWWKEGQNAFLGPDSRKCFNANKGSGTLTLLNVSFADVGRYYCQVKSQQDIVGNGSGSELFVLAPPTPLKIIRVEETSPTSRKLICKTAAFYPKTIDIFWRRNNMDILTNIETSINETSEGFYEAYSTLEDTQPAQGKVVYTCLISHESLKTPASFSYIVEQENSNKSRILGCALGGLAILIIILIRIGVKTKLGIKTASEEASHSGEPVGMEPAEHTLAYATINVREIKRIHHGRCQDEHIVYAKTRRGGDENLTYATLQLPNNKISAIKHGNEDAVYADVRLSQQARN